MKALRITSEHEGRVWKAETSDGRRGMGASLESCLDKISSGPRDYKSLSDLFAEINDSGGSGQIARGQASG